MSSSHEKRVPTLNERMRATESELRRLNTSLSQERNNIAAQVNASVRLDAERREQYLQNSLISMHADIRDLEANSAERLREHRQETLRQAESFSHQIGSLDRLVGEQGEHLRHELKRSEERLNRDLDRERQERESQLETLATYAEHVGTTLSTHIADVAAKEKAQRDRAQEYLEAAHAVQRHIENSLQPERFMPGELHKRLSKLCVARSFMDSAPAAALSSAATVYLDWLEFRNELEMLSTEWLRWHAHALESIEFIAQTAQGNRTCSAVDTDNQPLGDIDVNTWTGNKLSAFEDKINCLLQQVRAEPPSQTSALQQLVVERASELGGELEEIIKEARLNAMGARRRFIKLREAVELTEGRASLKEHGADWATMETLNGSLITIRIAPGEESAQDVLDLDFRQTGMNEEDRREYAKEVQGRFQEGGLIGADSAFHEVPSSPRSYSASPNADALRSAAKNPHGS